MKILYSDTKTGARWKARALNYQGAELSDVYGRYSLAKYRAWQWLLREVDSDARKGWLLDELRICSHNTFGFTAAWEAYRIDPRTKRKTPAWIIHTPSNEYWVFEI